MLCISIHNWMTLIIQKWMNVTIVIIIQNWMTLIIQKRINVTVGIIIQNWMAILMFIKLLVIVVNVGVLMITYKYTIFITLLVICPVIHVLISSLSSDGVGGQLLLSSKIGCFNT